MNLKKNMFINFVTNKLKTSTQLKRQLRKISTVNGILITADVNWNTVMRVISNKQNSSELIKLP